MTSHVDTIYTAKKRLNKVLARREHKRANSLRAASFKDFMRSQRVKNICYIGVCGIAIPQPLYL